MRSFAKKETICPDCENCVPNPETGKGCSWSRQFKPVEGWTAEKTKIVNRTIEEGKEYTIDSYKVLDCPLFKSDVHLYARTKMGKQKKGTDIYAL